MLDFGLSRLTSLQFIQYHVAGFYKPTIPQSTPPFHLRDYSTCNNARLEFFHIFVPSFDPNEWCLKNGLHSGGLTSRSWAFCLNHKTMATCLGYVSLNLFNIYNLHFPTWGQQNFYCRFYIRKLILNSFMSLKSTWWNYLLSYKLSDLHKFF